MESSSYSLPTNIKVYCRIRSQNNLELKNEGKECITISKDRKTLLVRDEFIQTGDFSCTFDEIFPPISTQDRIYDTVCKPIVFDFFNGYNGSIIAYGQTGSGKTHTIIGPKEGVHCNTKDKGIIPRVVDDLFEWLSNDSRERKEISISIVEIYMEKIRDLLSPKISSSCFKIREDMHKGIYIEGISIVDINTRDEMIDTLYKGMLNRTVSSTGMNKYSSRSHTVLTIYLKQKSMPFSSTIKSSKLYIVDLAGSELANKTFTKGQNLKESKIINQSLSSLSNVINAIIEKRPHIPYRNSKLTRILQNSFSGNSKTLLILTASISNYNISESISTFRFGMRAKQIKLSANIEQLEEDEKNELRAAHDKINQLTEYINYIEKLFIQERTTKKVISVNEAELKRTFENPTNDNIDKNTEPSIDNIDTENEDEHDPKNSLGSTSPSTKVIFQLHYYLEEKHATILQLEKENLLSKQTIEKLKIEKELLQKHNELLEKENKFYKSQTNLNT